MSGQAPKDKMTSEDWVKKNRASQKWTVSELAGRLLWDILWPAFRLSPRLFWGWRRFLLRLFGARIGRGVHIYPSVRVTIPWNITIGDYSAIGDRAILYALGTITIGSRVTISQNAHLCAGSHDHKDPARPLTKPPIIIEDDAWICADAFVGPGVTVGSAAIVGARSVATKDVDADTTVVGNPAQKVERDTEPES